jgi:hypothetical protein
MYVSFSTIRTDGFSIVSTPFHHPTRQKTAYALIESYTVNLFKRFSFFIGKPHGIIIFEPPNLVDELTYITIERFRLLLFNVTHCNAYKSGAREQSYLIKTIVTAVRAHRCIVAAYPLLRSSVFDAQY